jgi:transposase InsO family protein
MKAEMSAQLVTDALLMAIWRRGRNGSRGRSSDQGRQATLYATLAQTALEPADRCLECDFGTTPR